MKFCYFADPYRLIGINGAFRLLPRQPKQLFHREKLLRQHEHDPIIMSRTSQVPVPRNKHQTHAGTVSTTGRGPIRVLLISFHFPPMNVISAYRAEGFARYLPDHGMEVTVLTTTRDERTGGSTWHAAGTPVEVETWERARVIRIPRVRTGMQRFIDASLRIPMWSKLVVLGSGLMGSFNVHMVDVHQGYKRYLRKTLRKDMFDVVLATAPPDEHIALGAWVARTHGIPFVADYRDPYDTRSLMAQQRMQLATRVLLDLKRHHHRHWAKHISLVTSISGPLLQHLAKDLHCNRVLEVRNGFLPGKANTDEQTIRSDRFCITYAGRIYPWQDVLPFTRAYRLFMERLTLAEQATVDLQMYGCQDPDQIALIKNELRRFAVGIEAKRIPEAKNYARVAESAVLIVFDIAQVGGYTGKLMDYLGCRRNVLLIPSDHGVMGELVRSARIGMATDDPEQAAEQLISWYREWKLEGRPTFHGDNKFIEQGSRKVQTARLADALKSLTKG